MISESYGTRVKDSVTFGMTPARALLSAATVAVLGLLFVAALARMASREGSPLHAFFAGIGVSGTAVFAVGSMVVIVLSVVGGRKALTGGTRFTIAEEGLRVAGPAGRYVLAWENIERIGAVFEKDLGVAVWDRDAVVATHNGTAGERERFGRLIAAERYQGWDFHYFRHELGMPVDRALFLLEQARLVTRLDGGQSG